jgi:hypothetical protein
MAANSPEDQGAESASAGEMHNSVLIRTHEPARMSHSWVAPAVLGVAILGAAAIWGFIATHPSGPVVNHSVSAAPTSFAPSSAG